MGDKDIIPVVKEIIELDGELTPEKMREMGHRPMKLNNSPGSQEICDLPDDDPIKACFENPNFHPPEPVKRVPKPMMLPGVPAIENHRGLVKDQILELMIEIEEGTIDTDKHTIKWDGSIFCRLGTIFLDAGGEYRELKKEFPHYYE